MKSASFYTRVVLLWWGFMLLFLSNLLTPAIDSLINKSPILSLTVFISALTILYFWLNGLKDIMYSLYYHVFFSERSQKKVKNRKQPHVALLYVTNGQINEASLLSAINQQYKRVTVTILDESEHAATQKKITALAKKYHLFVYRQERHVGQKMSLVNSFLHGNTAEFFVVFDRHTLLPKDFIKQALPHFSQKKIGAVQAHMAHFPKEHGQVTNTLETFQQLRAAYGFLPFFGHATMIRKKAYEAVDIFPSLSGLDMDFTLALCSKGYVITYAQHIRCESMVHKTYRARRSGIRLAKNILTTNMRWFEKVDAFLSLYQLPLPVIFASYTTLTAISLLQLHYRVGFSLFILCPTLFFLMAPIINEFIFLAKRDGFIVTTKTKVVLLIQYSIKYYKKTQQWMQEVGEELATINTQRIRPLFSTSKK